jgi:hypothetical protein
MPGLSVAEQNHWHGRIAARIDRRIEAIVAHDSEYMKRADREARARAMESLGLVELYAELDAIAAQSAELKRRERRTRLAIVARVRGVSVETIEEGEDFSPCDPEVESAIARRQTVHEEHVFAATPLGREVLKLRIERECLLDVDWLTIASVQARSLWTKVSELLGAMR